MGEVYQLYWRRMPVPACQLLIRKSMLDIFLLKPVKQQIWARSTYHLSKRGSMTQCSLQMMYHLIQMTVIVSLLWIVQSLFKIVWVVLLFLQFFFFLFCTAITRSTLIQLPNMHVMTSECGVSKHAWMNHNSIVLLCENRWSEYKVHVQLASTEAISLLATNTPLAVHIPSQCEIIHPSCLSFSGLVLLGLF